MKKRISKLTVLALLWLYLPLMLFSVTWLKLPWAILAVVSSGAAIYCYSTEKNTSVCCLEKSPAWIVCAAVGFLLLLIWCALSGLGGFVHQTSDWVKHNVLLHDLIQLEWPVRYDFHGQGVMCYYIAEYLIPALIGKALGFHAAEIAELVCSAVGLFLTCLLIYRNCRNKKPYVLLLIPLGLFLFSTFMYPIQGIYWQWFPEDVRLDTQWMSMDPLLPFSSNIALLRWVFPQFVGTSIAAALFMEEKEHPQKWLLIAFPLILHSTFTFLGMGVLMVLTYMQLLFHEREKLKLLKNTFSKVNLLSVPMGLVLLGYIMLNFTQKKPQSANMGFGFITYGTNWAEPKAVHLIALLIAFTATWAIWALLLIKAERKNSLLVSLSISLLLFSFVRMGEWNDLGMRGSIPALLVLCYLVIRAVVDNLTEEKFYAAVLIGCLMITGVGASQELLTQWYWEKDGTKLKDGETSQSYYEEADFMLYQYIAWDQKAGEYLLRK